MKGDIIKTVICLFFLFVIAGGMISSVERKKEMRADSVEVEIEPSRNGHFFLTEDELTGFLEDEKQVWFNGQPLQEIDLLSYENYIEAEPFVADADAWVDANSVLHVKVRQREPLARIVTGRNEQLYLDTEGEFMPLSKHHSARVMLVDGHIMNEKDLTGEEGKAFADSLFRFATKVASHPILRAQTEQVHVKNDGEVLIVPKLGKHKILFGELNQIEGKLNKLIKFYEEIIPNIGWNEYRTVDLRYDKQIIGKKT